MLNGLFASDAHAGYIIASYGITGLVLVILCLYLVRDLSKQWRQLRKLEKETGKQRHWT